MSENFLSVPMFTTDSLADELDAKCVRLKTAAPIRKRWNGIMLALQPGDSVSFGKETFIVSETVRIQGRGTQAFARDRKGRRVFFGWEHLATSQNVVVNYAPKFKSK